jgi:hypothetical protein
MEGGDKDKDNRRTKLKTASARRANAEENPHIKRARKKGPPSQSDAAPSTAGPEHQPHPKSRDVEPQPQPKSQDVEPQPQSAGDVDHVGMLSLTRRVLWVNLLMLWKRWSWKKL